MFARLTVLILALATAPLASAAVDYHGFHIDDSALGEDQKASAAAAIMPSVIEQIKIVETVGLPPAMLEFFKQVKIVIDPELRGQPGVFVVERGEGSIKLALTGFPANKPILLHELLHAYHFKVLGLNTAAIIDGYKLAKAEPGYPAAFQRAHFLENPKEYFAVTGTFYVFGPIQQPPFNCAVLRKSDPQYLAFLEKTFGPHDCRGQ